MLCDRCEKEVRPAGVLPTLELKALGLYPSDRMTMQGDKRTIAITAAGGSAAVPQSLAEIGTVDITFTQDQPFQPTSLHRLPGLPINAYPIIKDVSVVARVTAGTLATPFIFVGFLKYRGTADKDHIIMPLTLSDPTAIVPTDSSMRAPIASSQGIIIVASQLGEAPIRKFGAWVLEGFLTLGTATALAIDVFANIGILYGAPSAT